MGRATRTTVPDHTVDVGEALDAAEARLAALRTLGVAAPQLAAKLDEGRAALAAGSLAAAQARADEVRIVVKLAAGELSRMLNHDGPPVANMLAQALDRAEPQGAADAPAASSAGPAVTGEAEEAAGADLGHELSADVAAVVEDAFGKALYSKQLRQMVEIVAAERLRAFLKDPELIGPIIAGGVRAELRAAVAEARAEDERGSAPGSADSRA